MTKQYEWKVEQFHVNDFHNDNNEAYVDVNLSEKGYKLHTVVSHESVGNYITMIFEREKKPEVKKPEVTWEDYGDVDAGVDAMREQRAFRRTPFEQSLLDGMDD